jgi:NAD(P)-dependent dehydrogenase (short-subunit alcohol dehydrogenase family)
MSGTAVVFGARNLGGAIIERLLEQGWKAAGVARSPETVRQVEQRGALGVQATRPTRARSTRPWRWSSASSVHRRCS